MNEPNNGRTQLSPRPQTKADYEAIIAIFATLFVSLALAEDFKTMDGKAAIDSSG